MNAFSRLTNAAVAVRTKHKNKVAVNDYYQGIIKIKSCNIYIYVNVGAKKVATETNYFQV